MAGYISEVKDATRVAAHGKITSLADDFELYDKTPFSIFIVPTTGTADVVVLSVRLTNDNDFEDCPIAVGDWCPLAIEAIEADASILNSYDIYWGAGAYVSPEE